MIDIKKTHFRCTTFVPLENCALAFLRLEDKDTNNLLKVYNLQLLLTTIHSLYTRVIKHTNNMAGEEDPVMPKIKWKNTKGLSKFDFVKLNPFHKEQVPVCISYKSKLDVSSLIK